MDVSGQLHAPAALPREKSPWYPLDRRLGGPQSRTGCGGEEKNSQPPPGDVLHLLSYYPISIVLKIRAVIAHSVKRWATGWTIGVLGFDSRVGLGIFLFTTASRTKLEPTQPPIHWIPGVLSLGVKREADHSHLVPRSKNEWSYTSTP
jgi:hypothetical protein